MTKNLRFVMWAVFAALTGCLVMYVYMFKFVVIVGEKIAEELIQFTAELKKQPEQTEESAKIVPIKKTRKRAV